MKTILTIKTDKELKTQAQEVAKELGIPLTTVINSFLRQFVRDRQLVLSADYKPSIYLNNLLFEAEQDLSLGDVQKASGVDNLLKILDD